MTPTIKAAADHLPGNSQRYREWNDLPAYVIGNTQADNERHGQMNIDEPTHRILLRAHAKIAKGNVAEDCEGQQTDQGDVEFYVQKDSLENGGRPLMDNPLGSFKSSLYVLIKSMVLDLRRVASREVSYKTHVVLKLNQIIGSYSPRLAALFNFNGSIHQTKVTK